MSVTAPNVDSMKGRLPETRNPAARHHPAPRRLASHCDTSRQSGAPQELAGLIKPWFSVTAVSLWNSRYTTADQSPTTTSVDREGTLGSKMAAVAQTLMSTVNCPRSAPVETLTIRLSAKAVSVASICL